MKNTISTSTKLVRLAITTGENHRFAYLQNTFEMNL